MSKKLTKRLKPDVHIISAKSRRAFIRSPEQGEVIDVLNNITLYRYVYSSTLSFACVFVLLISFFLQGFYVVSANEIETTGGNEISLNDNSEADTVTTESTPENVNTEQSSLPEEVVTIDDQSVSNNEDVVDINSEEIELDSDTGTTTAEENSDVVSVAEDEVGVDDTSLNNENVNITTPTSTDATTTHESISVVENDGDITFSEDDCTKLSDGSFYCKEIEENQLEDGLFSARDQDGDLEIFLIRDGKQAQITDNLVDDTSPYYDDISNTIVWQRLIDDRFQIISYDIEKSEEMQITDGSVNNMEPTRQGKYTVWQRWIGGSWNIVLNDGEVEKEITNNSSHNIAPHIQGSLVIWNKTSPSGEKTIEMYNIDTGAYVTVNDPEGLAVDNPRMVLVYDSLHPNGDIVTKGFDIFTGEFIQLDTLPKPLPEIPDSEATTEIKALIQPKPEVKYLSPTSPSVGNTNDVEGDDLISDLDLSISTTTEEIEFTLDLSQSSTTDNIETSEIEEIPDLVIPPFSEIVPDNATSTSV